MKSRTNGSRLKWPGSGSTGLEAYVCGVLAVLSAVVASLESVTTLWARNSFGALKPTIAFSCLRARCGGSAIATKL